MKLWKCVICKKIYSTPPDKIVGEVCPVCGATLLKA